MDLAQQANNMHKIENTNYMFSEDKDFSSKLKSFFSNDFKQGIAFRRSGRTFLSLRVLIEHSIETGEIVELFDHIHIYNRTSGRSFMQRVEKEMFKVLDWYENMGVKIGVKSFKRYGEVSFILDRDSIYNYRLIRIEDFTPKVKVEVTKRKLLLIS